jgi:5-deoxy-glucuronate isomerase
VALIERGRAQQGYARVVGPDDSDLNYIGFGLLDLPDEQSWEHTFRGCEALLVVLGGCCDVRADDTVWPDVGLRADVFGGKPSAVYLPPNAVCSVTARGGVEIAVCTALAEAGGEAALIAPGSVGVRQVGEGTYRREIYDILVPESEVGARLIVGETYNPPGLWSSYPPHKHDEHRPPEESKLEEVYHFRVMPARGFGIQRVYGEGLDETYSVQDRDTVVIAKGFHPVVSAPGYLLYYLWILAGEERIMRPWEDPVHAWISSQG